ncbi:Fur family transcriptional regulator [Peptacetobacter hominis]|uniref:Fur family transcriptional regulator n=1 Tax=Peptacetobacter hominis TaxID=2743610 RepID=A0A544QVM9_9FIRM|nr:transcriptional repressor [Peptacetobacter hominis]TQQ84748.1 Fur family transcriptional regulator [Peptacetobacter hominis]
MFHGKLTIANREKLTSIILEELKNKGYRITFQRKLILETILEEDSLVIKEIYYSSKKKDRSIGLATVYRFIRILQEAGIIDENEKFTFSEPDIYNICSRCEVVLSTGEIIELECCDLKLVMKKFLIDKGYDENLEIRCINTNL